MWPVLVFKTTWPFVITIKARGEKKRAGKIHFSPGTPGGQATPASLVLGPELSKWAAGNRKVPAVSAKPVPFETQGGCQLTGRCKRCWPRTWPFHSTDRTSLRELTWLNSCWAFLQRKPLTLWRAQRLRFPCRPCNFAQTQRPAGRLAPGKSSG